MRKSLILASFAIAGFGVGGAGVVSAQSIAPASPTPTIPGVPDLDAIMSVLTPEQLTCLMQSMSTVDPSDPMAALSAMTDCGISMEQLMQIGTGATATTTATEAAAATATAAPDAAAITAVLGLLGLDATELDCLTTGLATPPADDSAAYTVMSGCGLALTDLLQGIVDVNAGAATAAPSAPTTPGVTAAAVTTGDPIADMMIQQFESMGMSLDAEQASCLGEQITSGNVDAATISEDMTAVTNLLTTCGIDIAELVGG